MDLDTSKCLSRHELAQAEELPSVGGEDGDLGRQVLLAQEVLTQLYHKASLMLVLVAFAFLDFLFGKVVFYKEKVGRDPLERKRSDMLENPFMAVFSSYLHMCWSLAVFQAGSLEGLLYTPLNKKLVSHHVLCFGAMANNHMDKELIYFGFQGICLILILVRAIQNPTIPVQGTGSNYDDEGDERAANLQLTSTPLG